MLRSLYSLLLILPCALVAQDLNLIRPEPVPPQVEPIDSETPFAFESGEILVDELKGFVIGSSEEAISVVELTSGLVFTDSPWFDTPDIREGLDLYIGRPIDVEMLKSIPMALRVYLAHIGYPFSVVYLPEQDITDGVIRVVVLRSKIASELRIEGAEYFSEKQYRRALQIEPGKPLNELELQSDVERLNRNPFRSTAIEAEAGEAPGTTQLVLRVRETRPFRAFAGYNNTGTDTTTEDRMFAGFNWGNAFGLGHLMTMQVTTDFDVKYSKAASGNYTMELPNNHTLTLFGAYSEILGVPNGGLNQEGTSWQSGVNYTIPLLSEKKNYSHNLELGFDYKSSDNNLELSLPPFILPISDNLTHVVQFRGKYEGTLADAYGYTQFGAKLTYAPGGIGSYNDDASFSGSRALATADYLYGNLTVFRDTKFSSGPLEGFNWTVRGEVQLSDTNLLSSEQFSAGGSGRVRGYEEGEVIGDNAFFISQELLLPTLTPIIDLYFTKQKGSLRPFLFHDYARTWNRDELPGEKPFNLMSVGAGFRYQLGRKLSLNLAHGWQLRDSGSSDTGDNYRTHVSFQLSY